MQAFYETTLEKYHFRDRNKCSLECNPHLHYNAEIAVIYKGTTNVKVDNQEVQTVGDGDIVFVFPNQVHSFKTIEREDHVLLIFDPKLFPDFTHIFSEFIPHSNIVHGAGKDPELLWLIESIAAINADRSRPYREHAMNGYLLAFISRLLGMIKLKKINSEDMHAIGSVINYCILNYNKNLTLESLEKALHINRYYISHIMNQKLHISFNDYINSIRVSYACRYLMDSEMSMPEISALVGFNTVRSFNRAFVKHMGLSPRDYKKHALAHEGAGEATHTAQA